jgi:ATPase subunit of ABC transporter with duplicated ATPase domains
MHRVNKFHGPDKQVLADISLSFLPGAKIGVLGPNGAGKSTLLRIMAGLDEPSNGTAQLAPGATVGFLPQEPELDPAKDVRGNVEDGVAEKRDLLDTFNQLSARFAEPMSDDEMAALLEQQGEVQDRIERMGAWDLERDLDVAMDALRCPPSDADVSTLSGGERRRVALCRLLLSSPDLLLLDEPTNHLDAESVAWLEQFLERFSGTVLAVTHDRYFLDNVAGWILELDRVEIHIPAGERLGDKVVEATDLGKGFGDRLLIEDLSFSLPPGGIVGVIGPNGAGKTTLFRMIVGQEHPDAGKLELGDSVQVAYVDQARADLDPARSVWEEISDGKDRISLGKREIASRAYVSSFNFKGSDQQKRVGDLSGGERNRLHLAKLLRSGGNLLLLDEPTNDLDVDTLRALEDALLDFAGCAVVISHDRWFLDRVATHILAFEGDSQVVWFEGAYDEYEENKRKRLGETAAQPHRIKFKPLARTA